eukprot:COSAG02_NODE_8327_length_2613_cov_7.233038_3_plen_323_part_00
MRGVRSHGPRVSIHKMFLAPLVGGLVGRVALAAAASAVAALVDAEVAAGTTFAPWDVAISRRPYITEETGELLLQLDPATVVGGQLEVTATLPCAGASWNWTLVTKPRTEQYILPFSLTSLPQLLNNDMLITVDTSDLRTTSKMASGTLRRRFQRAWKANSTNTVQVDHTTRGLLVNGEPWAVMGWYIYSASGKGTPWEGPKGGPCDTNSSSFPKIDEPGYVNRSAECTRWGIGNMTAGVAKMGDRGITAVMPYHFDPYEPDGLSGLPPEELERLILNYYDVAHAHGVKVLAHMASLRFDRHGYTSEFHTAMKGGAAIDTMV